jgi:tRNA G18 (ribose-2'-O)-methylase SpoU
MESTLEQSDYILHIPMQGLKESLNVGQAAAIFMWELRKSLAL